MIVDYNFVNPTQVSGMWIISYHSEFVRCSLILNGLYQNVKPKVSMIYFRGEHKDGNNGHFPQQIMFIHRNISGISFRPNDFVYLEITICTKCIASLNTWAMCWAIFTMSFQVSQGYNFNLYIELKTVVNFGKEKHVNQILHVGSLFLSLS